MDERLVIAASAQEAAKLAASGAGYLAGGTELNRLGSPLHYQRLVSISRVAELRGVEAGDGEVLIGATTSFQEALQSELVPAYLKEALLFMGSRTKRNMATVGGNVAAWRDDSYLAATLLAVGASIGLMNESGATRRLSVAEWAQTQPEHRLVRRVIVPADPGWVTSKRYANTMESLSYLVVSLCLHDGAARVALTVKGVGAFVSPELSDAASRGAGEDELVELAYGLDATIPSDMYGSERYKRYLAGVTLARMLEDAGRDDAR
ncbi:xanthine dehydrogenase family protein subunit M [Olsenella sp. DNF00959]|uniref:FAD binding domain-containing protein n=1 Tax=Olsenella sp. DNF00959 TaxID=1476999 RepID=UPI00078336B5|nr:FAD binding domain-containing protein [Olsenella sp. DNF00959]KXB63666.1 putative selenate reductase, FAD-binding subunit [Olsenella sp. DNF00959]